MNPKLNKLLDTITKKEETLIALILNYDFGGILNDSEAFNNILEYLVSKECLMKDFIITQLQSQFYNYKLFIVSIEDIGLTIQVNLSKHSKDSIEYHKLLAKCQSPYFTFNIL